MDDAVATGSETKPSEHTALHSGRPRVVILGAGFGGLNAARGLAHAFADVTVVDRKNHHVFQPLLYQVATAALNPSDIAMPIRHILRNQANTGVILADVVGVDTKAKKVILSDGELVYDYLVVATGSSHSYFGRDDWAQDAPGLKTIDDALRIRRRVLLAYENAERETDPERRREWLTFVIVGGGPTGVELAGALAEIARHSLVKDFRHIDSSSARILLVEGQPHVLPMFSDDLRIEAERELARIGVEVKGGSRVTEVDGDGVMLDGARVRARTVLWAAGNKSSPVAATLGVPLDRAGRVAVDPDLTLPGRKDVFVIGDLAVLTQNGKMVTGLAPIAMQEGKLAARNILRALHGEPYLPFHYVDRGSYATIGRGAAVGEIFGHYKSSGFFAWMAWLTIHLFFLIGFRNRLLVLIDWAYSYLTWRRGARLITNEPE